MKSSYELLLPFVNVVHIYISLIVLNITTIITNNTKCVYYCRKNPFAVGCRGISAKRDPNWSGVGLNAPVVASTDNAWTHQLALVPQNQLVLDLARWKLNSQLADFLFASRVASSSSSSSSSFNG